MIQPKEEVKHQFCLTSSFFKNYSIDDILIG